VLAAVWVLLLVVVSRAVDAGVPSPAAGRLAAPRLEGRAAVPGAPLRIGGDLDSACRAMARGMLSDTWVSRGDRVVVRTRIAFSCPEQRRPYHLAFVLDAAALRDAGPTSMLADDVRALAEAAALADNRFVRAAVVAYGERADAPCEATRDPDRLADCLERVAAPEAGWLEGAGGLGDGMWLAAKVLYMARGQETRRASDDPLREAIVVVEGVPACAAPGACAPERSACAEARAGARWARAAGIELAVVCLADDCAGSCVAHLADRVFDQYQWDAMTRLLRTAAWRSELRVAGLDMSESLHPSLLLDPESVDYGAGTYDAREHGLTWHMDARGRGQEPIALSYAVTATEPGTFPVRVDGGGVLVDTHGLAAAFTIPQHELRVAGGPLQRLYLPRSLQAPPRATQPSKPLAYP